MNTQSLPKGIYKNVEEEESLESHQNLHPFLIKRDIMMMKMNPAFIIRETEDETIFSFGFVN